MQVGGAGEGESVTRAAWLMLLYSLQVPSQEADSSALGCRGLKLMPVQGWDMEDRASRWGECATSSLMAEEAAVLPPAAAAGPTPPAPAPAAARRGKSTMPLKGGGGGACG